MKAFVTSAALPEQEGLFGILDASIGRFPLLKKIWADGGYQGAYNRGYCSEYGLDLEVVKRQQEKGFKILPRRWVVERTFAWMGKQRRMSKDYEFSLTTSEAMVYLSMIRLMVKRAAREITL